MEKCFKGMINFGEQRSKKHLAQVRLRDLLLSKYSCAAPHFPVPFSYVELCDLDCVEK